MHEDKPQARAAATYNAAADHFDAPALSYWERFGRQTVARLGLRPGARVLDVCCGTGASALAAAEQVGPDGTVLGVDVAERMLALARAKAAQRGLFNAEFRQGDVLALDLLPESFDAMVCVFGLFFLPDMAAALTRLWRFVRPGGVLAITSWGPRVLEPANGLFWQAVRDVRPDLHETTVPWARIAEPASLCGLFAEAGVPGATAESQLGIHPLRSPEDWWDIVLGSGHRSLIEAMTPAERQRVRDATLAALRERGVSAVEVNVLFAVARKAAV
jgi:ubiquinone/menaquinone biosynthesis C-methylase UbiE